MSVNSHSLLFIKLVERLGKFRVAARDTRAEIKNSASEKFFSPGSIEYTCQVSSPSAQ